MNNYIITVSKESDITILITAKDKTDAIYMFIKEYTHLHDKYNWSIKVVDLVLK